MTKKQIESLGCAIFGYMSMCDEHFITEDELSRKLKEINSFIEQFFDLGLCNSHVQIEKAKNKAYDIAYEKLLEERTKKACLGVN